MNILHVTDNPNC